jgi:hypothetical protein
MDASISGSSIGEPPPLNHSKSGGLSFSWIAPRFGLDGPVRTFDSTPTRIVDTSALSTQVQVEFNYFGLVSHRIWESLFCWVGAQIAMC